MTCAEYIVLFANQNGELQQTVKELTKLSTDAGSQINTKKTKVTTNSAEIEIKLNAEAFEYVPEYTYVGQLISFSDNPGKGVKKLICMAWNKFKSLGITLAEKVPKTRDVVASSIFPVLL